MQPKSDTIAFSINSIAEYCNAQAIKAGWWHDLATGRPKERNKGELFMLMVSEIAEAMEGVRKDKMDDHLPQYKSETVELADCLIRIFDYAGNYGLNIGEALVDKMAYNAKRPDHKPENRALAGGKKF
jgi:NTP pyrophosphatase (non-canonical NTP hydrolase)